MKHIRKIGIRRTIRRLYWWMRHRGNVVCCPFCGSQFSEFMPGNGITVNHMVLKNVIGGGRRKNCICPRCESKDRERHLILYLENKNLLITPPGTSLLHVAPEPSLERKLRLIKNVEYISSDLVPVNIAAMEKMDITNIKYEDNYFDIIICNHVLEHISNDTQALSELFRTLKPKGWAILQVPFDPTLSKTLEDPSINSASEQYEIFGDIDHVRIYGKDYANRLQNAGFKVRIDNSITQNHELVKKYGLLKEEPIFFCEKGI